jgi:hypothetical protein
VTAGWLALAEQADARLPGVSDVITTGSAPRWLFPTELVDRWLADPLAWSEREPTNLVAAVEAAVATASRNSPGSWPAASPASFDAQLLARRPNPQPGEPPESPATHIAGQHPEQHGY